MNKIVDGPIPLAADPAPMDVDPLAEAGVAPIKKLISPHREVVIVVDPEPQLRLLEISICYPESTQMVIAAHALFHNKKHLHTNLF